MAQYVWEFPGSLSTLLWFTVRRTRRLTREVCSSPKIVWGEGCITSEDIRVCWDHIVRKVTWEGHYRILCHCRGHLRNRDWQLHLLPFHYTKNCQNRAPCECVIHIPWYQKQLTETNLTNDSNGIGRRKEAPWIPILEELWLASKT